MSTLVTGKSAARTRCMATKRNMCSMHARRAYSCVERAVSQRAEAGAWQSCTTCSRSLIEVNRWKRNLFILFAQFSRQPLRPHSVDLVRYPWWDEATSVSQEWRNEETNGWTDSISQGPFCTTFSCFFFGYTSDELVRGSRRERTK